MTKKRICMLAMNEVVRDGRIIRCARTLSEHAEVMIVGLDREKFEVDAKQASQDLNLKIQLAKFGQTAKRKRNTLGYIARYRASEKQMMNLGVKSQPDIVHAHDFSTLRIAKLIAKKTGAKVVYDAHELYREMGHTLKGLAGFFRNRIENWALKNANLIIACNHFRAEIMQKEYGAWMLPVVVKNAVPFREIEPNHFLRDKFEAINPEVKTIMMYQGLVSPTRCLEELVAALPEVDPTIGLAIIGIGADTFLNKLRENARALGVENRLLIVPPVSQAELHPISCGADIGVVLYRPDCRNNYYCAPNKLQEYAMAGLALVGADLPPIRQFLEEYKCGLTVDPDDKSSIIASLNKMAHPETLAAFRGNTARAAKEECWDRASQSLVDAYRDHGFF